MGGTLPDMDDVRVGRVARVLRQRLGWRQEDVALSAACSQDEVSLLERGRIESMSLRRLRSLFRVFDAEIVVLVRWGVDLSTTCSMRATLRWLRR